MRALERSLEALRSAGGRRGHKTFETFRDYEESPFYVAEGRTPEETWEEIRERLVETEAVAVGMAEADEDVSPGLVADWHRQIFETTFPDEAGRIRQGRETVGYGYVIGTPEAPIERQGRGTNARELPKRLEAICDEFNQGVRGQRDVSERRLVDATRAATIFFVKLISAHPFADGNARTAVVGLQYALVRIGLIGVALTDYTEVQFRLGQALRTDANHSYEPFADYLAEEIRRVAD